MFLLDDKSILPSFRMQGLGVAETLHSALEQAINHVVEGLGFDAPGGGYE